MCGCAAHTQLNCDLNWSLQQCLVLLKQMKVFHSSHQESLLMQNTELPCWKLFSWNTHICFQVCMVFGCSLEHSFYHLPPLFSALAAFEWVSLEQRQANSWLLFLSVAIGDALYRNKGKTWSQVMTPRNNVFSVPFLKGWNLRVFLTQGLWPNHTISQNYSSAQPFIKCSGVELYGITWLLLDSCFT